MGSSPWHFYPGDLCHRTAASALNLCLTGHLPLLFIISNLIFKLAVQPGHRDVWTDLWCQIESQVAIRSQAVLDQQRDFVRKAELDGARQTTCLAEIDQVLQRERQGNGLGERDVNVELWLLYVGMTS